MATPLKMASRMPLNPISGDMMRIEHLTAEQVEMLDFMWNELDTEEDYLNWYACLDEQQQIMADGLQRLVIMEAMDEQLENQKSFPEVQKMLDRLGL